MPCPNDHREKSVTVGFRMTPEQKRWLDRVADESGMTKQDFITARLHDEAITVAPNIRVCRALRDRLPAARATADKRWRERRREAAQRDRTPD